MPADWCIHISSQVESVRSSEANRQACCALQLMNFALICQQLRLSVASVSVSLPCFCRNTGKIKDWIDAVYVKKRFYSAEAAASAAMHSPPPSQSHVSLVIDTLLYDSSLLLHFPFCLRHLVLVTAYQNVGCYSCPGGASVVMHPQLEMMCLSCQWQACWVMSSSRFGKCSQLFFAESIA